METRRGLEVDPLAKHVIFSHGKDSAPWGGKISALAPLAEQRGCTAHSIDYRGIDNPGERVAKLIQEGRQILATGGETILVGSSMGGHVAAAAASELPCVGLFLMAPAFYIAGYEHLTPAPIDCPVHIVHGWQDDVIPYANSVRYASEYSCVLHLVNGDHRLQDNLREIQSYFGLFLDIVVDD